jgi:hypothetical protein
MKINEIITENDELNEWVPAVIAGVGRVATALAPKIKTAWNAIKGTTKSTTKSNKDLISKSDDMYGLNRTLPGGKVGGALTKVTKNQKDWLSGTKLSPNAKSMTAKTKTKSKPNKKTALSKQITKSIKLNKTTSKPNPHADTNKIGLGRSNNVNKAFADKTRLDNFRAGNRIQDKLSGAQQRELQKLQNAAKVSGSKVSPKVLK